MQTIEKALHQPMPFTTGGQTITDRLTAAKHSLAGSQLGKTICKATTEELMAPKKKHLDYLLHCTNEPNVSIPSMANMLIERTQNPNWTVVYKALITIHNIMCYGNERFSQYLASCNTTFNLGSFLDKGSTQGGTYPSQYYYTTSRNWASLDSVVVGYDMSQHVRRYGKYISEKIYTYRLCAYDFCKVKRGREDGLLRTMNTDKLLKTLPILQNQIDALLQFQVTSVELNNGVINCSFILLFRDLIRLFACYNDGIINLLEKYFDMNKKQCRDALDMYKAFLLRLDKVAEFLKVAETVGIDRGEIPDLTHAPASLLEALEAHLVHLEGGKLPQQQQQQQANHSEQFAAAMSQTSSLFTSEHPPTVIEDSAKQKYLEEEKERLRMFEEQRKKQAMIGGGGGGADEPNLNNPFASALGAGVGALGGHEQTTSKPSDDLLSLFDPVPALAGGLGGAPSAGGAIQPPPQVGALALDPTNPFAQNIFAQQPQTQTQTLMTGPSVSNAAGGYTTGGLFGTATNSTTPAFGADFSRAFAGTGATGGVGVGGAGPTSTVGVAGATSVAAQGPYGAAALDMYGQQGPLATGTTAQTAGTKFGGNDLDSALSSLADNLSIGGKAAAANQGKPVQWNSQQGGGGGGGGGGVRAPMVSAAHQMPFAAAGAPQMAAQQWPLPMGPGPGAGYPPQAAALYGGAQQPTMMGIYGGGGAQMYGGAGAGPGGAPGAPQQPQNPVATGQPQQQRPPSVPSSSSAVTPQQQQASSGSSQQHPFM